MDTDGASKSYSCLTCRQRKVKCDKRNPCSNCVKAEKPCSFVQPVRGKRKRTKAPREGLHAKLKRYEEMLKAYGAKIEPSDDLEDDGYESGTLSHEPDVEMDENSEPRVHDPDFGGSFVLEETKPHLVTKDGTSRYFDSPLGTHYGDGFRHPEAEVTDNLRSMDEPATSNDNDLFFECDHSCRVENLAGLHPAPHVLVRLKDIFLERVHPLMNVYHIPSFWDALMNALRQPQQISNSLLAEIFAFYLACISSLTDVESESLFGTGRLALHRQYRRATRQALINAGFLSTASPMTLRAFGLFIICVRNNYRGDTLYALSGIAIRLARKMGMHRDGTNLGLPLFETEMRRRLWWHLVHVDFKTADVLGIKPSLDLMNGDTKMPLNVEDSDLHPNITEPPIERKGITSIALTLTRCEIMEVLRKISTTFSSDARWEVLFSPSISVAKKDKVISQIEDKLEGKYLRYCDPSDPHHTFVSIMIRSAICKMKLLAHSPRHYASNPGKATQASRDIVFQSAMKLLEYVTLIQGGYHGMDKYMWQIGTNYLWNTMLYVLIETQHRKTGPEVEKAWQLIGVIFSHRPQVFEDPMSPVYSALGKWTLEVWDDYVVASKEEGLLEPAMLDYISAMKKGRKPVMETPSDIAMPPTPIARNSALPSNRVQPQRYEASFTDFEPSSYEFPNLLSFEMDPNEWLQWEQLLAEQGGFVQPNGVYQL